MNPSHLTKLIVLLLASLVALPAAAAPAKSPNFLVILTDDQSWVGTSLLMNPDRPDTKSDYFKTPHMDALLSAGMRFTDGYASGAWCTPSRRSIQSGLCPSQHIYNRAPDGKETEFAKRLSLPRMLKAVNPAYTCAHFGKWHLQYDSVTPEVTGYDVSDGSTANANGDMAHQPGAARATPKNVPDVWDDPKTIFSLTKRTADFIETQIKAGRPWFVQLSHYAVHLKISYRQETYDRLKDRPVGQKHAIPEFAAMTEDLDTGIGQLLARLESLKVLTNTYIIFLSDNGGRGILPVAGKPAPKTTQGKNYPLAAAKHSIYEGGLRVPFGISGPGIKPGAVSHVPVSGVDILPTIADLAGYAGSLGSGLDGGSFKDVALGKTTTVKRPRDFLVFESHGHNEPPRHTRNAKPSDYKAALRMGDYKLIKFYGGTGDGQKELYNLADDLSENRNLASTMPDRAKQMEKLLDTYLTEVGGLKKNEGPRQKDPVAKKRGRRKQLNDE
jgi:arylsulfatase A